MDKRHQLIVKAIMRELAKRAELENSDYPMTDQEFASLCAIHLLAVLAKEAVASTK